MHEHIINEEAYTPHIGQLNFAFGEVTHRETPKLKRHGFRVAVYQ